MATTSIWRVKGWLGKVVIYVENPDKTDNPAFYEKRDMSDRQVQGLSDVIDYADLNGGGRRFYLKPAAAIMSARRAGTTATWDQLNKYFGLMQMPIITSRYWNMVHGTTPQEVMQDREGLATLRTLGHNMAYFLKCKEVGSKLVPLPPEEPWKMTNFIR